MADSGTYDQATILRRQKIAEQMLADSKPPTNMRSPLQGLAYLADTGVNAYNLNRLDAKAAESRKADTAALMAGIPDSTPSPGAAPPPLAPPTGGPGLSSVSPGNSYDPAGMSGALAPPRPAASPDAASAIAGIESKGSGGYNALGTVIPKTGDRAYGKYQVMGANIPAWTKEHVGQEMTPEQFLANPQAQEAVFKGQFGKYLDKYGSPEAASRAWFAGPDNMNNLSAKDPNGMTVGGYGQKFTAGMGGPQAIAAAMTPGAPTAFNGSPQPGMGMPPSGPAAGAGGPSPLATPTAGAPPAPTPAASGAIPGASPGVPQTDKERIARLLSATPGSAAYQLGVEQLKQVTAPHNYTFQTLPDGTVLRMDPTGRTPPTPVYNAPVKPELKSGGTDPITGQINYRAYDAKTNSWVPINNQAGGPGAADNQSGMLAKGVTSVNHDLSGEEYLNQYGPEVKSAVHAYIDGDVMPSGNPRANQLASTAKTIAQKYGADMGIPVSDALYTQKRNLIGEYGSGRAASLGGQRNSGNTAIGHLSDLAEQAQGLKNVNLGGWFPGIAGAINAGRQAVSADQASKANELNNTIDRYVAEVGKFYSGSSSGGVNEREEARKRFSSVKTPEELAGAISSEKHLFHSKLSQLEQQRDEVLKTEKGRSLVGDIISPKSRNDLQQIEQRIRVMRGGAPAPESATRAAPANGAPSVAGAVQEGATATNPQTGEKITFKGGAWVPVK